MTVPACQQVIQPSVSLAGLSLPCGNSSLNDSSGIPDDDVQKAVSSSLHLVPMESAHLNSAGFVCHMRKPTSLS